jgi:hypothetical protein
MTEIYLVDWTIQEAPQLKSERRQPSDLDGGPSLDRLFAALALGPGFQHELSFLVDIISHVFEALDNSFDALFEARAS